VGLAPSLSELRQDISVEQPPYIDFIVKLLDLIKLGTGQKCNAILVIVKQFTKYIKFILLSKGINTLDLAYTVIKAIMLDFRVLDKLITDRDKLFTLKF
jgi:hypothetical protein